MNRYKWYRGIVKSFNPKSGYGYIKNDDYGKILVHSRSLGIGVKPSELVFGLKVKFKLDHVRTGIVGRHVTPIDSETEKLDESYKLNEAIFLKEKKKNRKEPISKIVSELKDSNDYIKTASYYIYIDKIQTARKIFKEGIEYFPTKKLYVNFAKFEIKQNNLKAARNIYTEAYKYNENNFLICKELGLLELKLINYIRAVVYLEKALKLSKNNRDKSVIKLHLGESYYGLATSKNGTINIKQLKKAKSTVNSLSSVKFKELKYLILYNRISSVLTDNRISRSFELFEKSGFRILHIFSPNQLFIDYTVESHQKELRSTYGLREAILVRYLLKKPDLADLENLDIRLDKLVSDHRVDPSLSILIADNHDSIMGELGRRLESNKELKTIVPIDYDLLKEPQYYNERLRKILDQWLFKRDLYLEHFPVSGRYFFGREEQLKSLFANVGEGRHVGIFGLRKVGKTSFLWRVRDKCDTDIVAYVDLLKVPEAVKTIDYVLWDLGNEFFRDIKKKYPKLLTNMKFVLFGKYIEFSSLKGKLVSLLFDDDLNKLRNQIEKEKILPKPKMVILLDEVEKFLPSARDRGVHGYIDFFSYWRGQAQIHRDIVTIITAANPSITELAQWEKIDNPVYKFYKEEFFPPFNYKECSEMIKELGYGMGVNYTVQALKKIYSLTGGHPFIPRRFCSVICKNKPSRPTMIGIIDVRSSIKEFLRRDHSLFEEILSRLERDFPNEFYILEKIAKRGKLLETEIKDQFGRQYRTVINHLLGYQLIYEVNGEFKIGFDLLAAYMI